MTGPGGGVDQASGCQWDICHWGHAKLCGRVLWCVPGSSNSNYRSSDTVKSCLEQLTMSSVIGDSADLIFSAFLQTWVSLQMILPLWL